MPPKPLSLVLLAAATVALVSGAARSGAAPASTGCTTVMVTYHDGRVPARRPALAPPAPRVRATAPSRHTVRFTWSFSSLPARCRPAGVLLSVVNPKPYTPSTEFVAVRAKSGTYVMELPEFIPPASEGLASAVMRSGRRSKTVRFPIAR